MKISKAYSGVILAGGKNSRYGGLDKAFLEVDGQAIIDRILKSFQSLFSEIIIVSNKLESYPEIYQKYILTSDHYSEIGPLGGIHAAMEASHKPNLFIVSCDMPWVSKEAIEYIINKHAVINSEALIPSFEDKLEPLHAVYSRSTKQQLINHIETQENRSIRSFLKNIDSHFDSSQELKKYLKSFRNINSPEDFNKYV